MAKLDYNIYGADDNGFAESVSSDALKPGGKEDIWGGTFDQSAKAKGNDPENENPDAKSIKFTGSQKPPKSEGS